MRFVDLARQRQRLEPALSAAIERVLEHGRFIVGPEVAELEEHLAGFAGVRNVVTCANGTDALVLVLRCLGVGAGDAVFVPSFTFAATAEAVILSGAVPVFVDCLPNSFNIDPQSLERAFDLLPEGTRAGAVIAVDLFGQLADYDALTEFSKSRSLPLIADAAQSFGARWNGSRAGNFGTVTTTSFFPAKPLGCYGDGGAVLTDDDAFAAELRSVAQHGKGTEKYDHVRVGMNSRLDTLQAAVLLSKLTIFEDELAERQEIAGRYESLLPSEVRTPHVDARAVSSWAQYTIQVPDRVRVISHLGEAGIPTAVHYPLPLHHQPAFMDIGLTPVPLSCSESLARVVLSIPVHPYLTESEQGRIVDAIGGALAADG